jgi:hypothetical protein
MYSLKLKESKVKDSSTRLTVGIEVDEKEIVERIKNFCKADDIIGVQPSTVFSLFDDFCEKNGLSKITSNSFGKVIKKLFGVERKKVRKGKDLFWVYAYKKQI